ncbi:hypothetical protein H920_10342, partial [Fukomys damarensis]
ILIDVEEFISVPLQFLPLGPGRYPCKILLTSNYDVRIYNVEGVVNADQPEAAFQFETPAFEPLTQNIPIETSCIEIPISNPKDKIICIDVILTTPALSGLPKLTLNPLETINYIVWYSPAIIGYKEERHAIQTIPLYNPTHETLELQVTNSNPANFVLKINGTLPFEEWKFYLFGVGLFPRPIETAEMTTCIGLQSPIIIPFKNPTKENVSVNIFLTNEEQPRHLVIDHCWDSFMNENSAFRFSSLCRRQGIVLPPEGNVDILVLFKPKSMTLCKTLVIVEVIRANGENWTIDNFDELDEDFKSIIGIDKDDIQEIHWIYPIIGLPQAPLPKTPPPVVKCKSKKKIEMTLEITLIGNFFGQDPTPESTQFLVIPKRNSYCNVHEDYTAVSKIRVFKYEIEFESEIVKSNLESTVDLYLSTQGSDIENNMISLVFKLLFTPEKPSRSNVTLKIESIKDGIWKFPLILMATDPEVEEIINIRGVGLQKESTMNFRLASPTKYPQQFTASFLPGSDREFFVKPEAGKLPPSYSKGILITVGFKPKMYSKRYKATLVIQTDDMYWMYEINGLPPEPTPLINVKPKVNTTNQTYGNMPVHQRNFIRENSELLRTGVSSTIKGAPLVEKRK